MGLKFLHKLYIRYIPMKELVYGVKELQAHLSSALRAAQAGTRVVVTSHHRPILEIVIPRKPTTKLSAAERWRERMIKSGRLLPALSKGPIPDFKPLRIGGLLEQLQQDRR
jgi:antitoxin (DNA-binding transcriptional repressor) of toxin-antitoxin stability system